MANSDIQLLFSVLGGGSLSGESGSLIQSELTQILNELNKNPFKIKVGLDADSTKKSSWTAQLQKKLDALNAGNKLSVTVSNIKLSTNAISSFKQQLGAVINTLNVDKDVSVTFTSKDIGEITTQFRDVGDAATDAARKAAEFKVQMEMLSNLKTSVQKSLTALTNGNGSEEEKNRIAELTAQYEQWAVKIEEVRASKQATSGDYKAALEAEGAVIQDNIDKINLEREVATKATAAQTIAAESRRAAEEAAERAAEKARADEERARGTATERNNLYKQIDDSITRIRKARQDWSAAETGKSSDEYAKLGKYIEKLQELQSELSGLSKTQIREKLSAINSAFAKSSSAIKAAGENTKTLTGRIGNLANKFTSWLTVSQVIMKLYQAMKQMVTAVIEVDTAMTELRKVTDETESTYSKFLETAISRSKQLGATVADTVTASADFARLDYTLDEAAQLADAAIIYKNVGDGIEDITTASESIISTMKAFGIEAEGSMLIVDKFNEVGNNFAISSRGVGEALVRSASALAAGNNTLDESIALITAANSVVQDSDKVGTTLKTISMFLRAAKTEAEEAGESTEGMANSVSELRDEILALTGGKVDIQINEDTFKSTYQILKEISAVWGELTDVTQANILEMIGGKRNSNVVASVITNFDTAEKVMISTAEAAGSALKENEKYLESIEGRISEFKASFQELAVTFIDSDFVKLIVELGTGLLNILNAVAKVIDTVGGLNTVLYVTVGILATIKAESIKTFLVTTLPNAISKLTKSIASFVSMFAQLPSIIKAMDSQTALAVPGTSKLSVALQALGISATTAQFAMGALVAAIGIAIIVYQRFKKKHEELLQASEELTSQFAEFQETSESNRKILEGLSDEFDKLSRGVDQYGNNISLTADEYTRYKEIVEQIVGISPTLIEKYDKENGYIVNKNGLIERSIALLDEEYQAKLRNMATTGKLSTSFASAIDDYNLHANSDILTSDTALSNSVWQLLNVNDRNDIPKEYESGEFLAREILTALGYDNVDSALEQYFNEHGYWQSSKFWDDYVSVIAEDISSGNSKIINSIDWGAAGFENEGAFVNAVETAKSAAVAYNDVQTALASANSAIANNLSVVAESNKKYAELSDDTQAVVDSFVKTFGVEDVSKKSWLGQYVADDNAINFVKVQINDLIAKLSSPELQSLIDKGAAVKLGVDVDGNDISVTEYKKLLDDFWSALDNIEDDELKAQIKLSLGIEDDEALNDEVDKAIKQVKNLLIDEFDSKVDDMKVSEVLQVYYNISAEPNSMTFDGLQQELKYLNVDWDKTVNVWDFSAMTDGLSGVETGITDIANAMAALKDDTALTVSELAKLALKYPELLQASDLFTDTSVENQQALLDAVLSTYESEYDALIDTKIAELTATNQLIQDQIALENDKKNKVIEIADLQNNGKLDSEADYNRLLNELRDLEGRNYVAYSDGILSVNQNLLKEMLEQEDEKVEDSEPIFGAMGDLIADANAQGLTNALKAYPQFATNLTSWASGSLKQILNNIGTNISKAFKGDSDWVNLTEGINSISSITSIPVNVEAQLEGSYTIDEKSVDEWATKYEDVIEKRVKTLTDQIVANNTIIDNLIKLKGLNLTSLYGSKSNSSGNKSGNNSSVEEYLADIDEYYEALKRLESIQDRLSKLRAQIEYADTEEEKIVLTKQLINVYDGEADALENLNKLRSETIANGKAGLEALGFEVSYDASTNEFIVHNMEHLNELYGATQEETNELRKSTEELIDTMESLNSSNQEGTSSLRTLRADSKSAKQAIVDYLKEIVTAASDVVDEYQNVYEALHSAADEYAESGFITIDTLQSIIELGAQYMQCLMDENGLLIINEENINKVLAAKTQELALNQAITYVERLRLALLENSIEDLNNLLYATTEATNATWGLVYANLALLGLDDDQYQAALHNINAIRSLADSTISGIGQVSGQTTEELNSMKDGLDDILQYVMDMLKQRINDQIDALEDMKDAYADIIALRKEALASAEEEADYQDEVAEKVKEIANLQARINALSLDDSRDAQAQKAQLEEEMAELQKELADTQADYALDAQKDALDDMQDAYEKQKDAEIEVLEDSISSYQKLYDMAISYIESNWGSLYSELLAWNYQYGNDLDSTITTAWDNALAAAQRYGSYVSALNSIDADISSASGSGTNYTVGNTTYDSSSSNEEMIHAIIKEMYANSQAHHTASTEEKARLNKRNLTLGAMLAQYGVNAYRDNTGTWYVDSGELLYEKYKKYIYHTGGIAGDQPTLKQNEILAVLEKGEAVLDERREKGLFRLVDFVTELSDKFGKLISNVGYGQVFPTQGIATADDLSAITSNKQTSVHLGDVYIYGTAEETAEKHREINREFTNEVLKQLNIKR